MSLLFFFDISRFVIWMFHGDYAVEYFLLRPAGWKWMRNRYLEGWLCPLLCSDVWSV